ncbi:hypothetical protein F8C76_11220 [Flagellimonas olearia]|uniref:Recombinase domain-containing protein n=1 Tax=Flagellimonas olearia TaxID=552546 RepID=A0A6I1E4D0_9FLAO|nr:recombinase family protein [Allomuricauda olearia]KAB7528426.1 hypothetical protein F8C76_11220 [Allomuricauda olearia]
MLAIYVRKSRDRKKEKSLKEQKLLGQEFAIENNLEFKIFDEGIVSGQKGQEERPKFAQLIDAIKHNKISGVYIWDSSRLARNEISWHIFANLLRDTGTILYDNGVAADFSNENTYLFYTIKAGMDAHFARVTAKKIKTVLRRNAIDKIPHGLLPYGYTTDINGKWKINDEEAKTVKLIFDLYEKGYGYIRIAHYLNEMGIDTRYTIEWTPATIRYMIYNKTYSGSAKFSDITIDVPPIIEAHRHQKLIDGISNRYKKPGAKAKKYILNEVMYCGKCGTRYTISQRKRNAYYRCLSEVNRGVEKCYSKALRAWAIDKLVFENILFGKELYEHAKKAYLEGGNETEKNKLKKRLSYHHEKLEKLKSQLARNYKAYVRTGGDFDLYLLEKKRIDKEILETDDTINVIMKSLEQIKNSDRILEELNIDLNQLPKQKNKQIIKEVLKKRQFEKNIMKINQTISYDEKVALVEKYIKRLNVNYQNKPIHISIEFNIPVPTIEILVESRYYAAKNLTNNNYYFLRDFGKRPDIIHARMQDEFANYPPN